MANSDYPTFYHKSSPEDLPEDLINLSKPGIYAGLMIRTLRIRQGIAQTTLAESVAVSGSYLGWVELGKVAPGKYLTWRIAKQLNVDYAVLVTEPNVLQTVRELTQSVPYDDLRVMFECLSQERRDK